MAQKEKEVVSIRMPQDTYEEFEEYRNERNLSKTDAGRRLLERSLRPDTQSEPEPQTLREQLRHAVDGQTVEWVLVMVVSVILSVVAPMQWVSIAALGLSAMGIVLALAGLWFDIKAALLPSLTRSPEVQEVSE